MVHARDRAGGGHRRLARARCSPAGSIRSSRSRRRCPRRCSARGRRTYAAMPAEVSRYVGETLLGARHRQARRRCTPTGTHADVGDHVSAPATTSEGITALDDAAGKPAFIWLHYFDVHEHHQIKVPEAAARRASTTAPTPKRRTAIARCSVAIDARSARVLASSTATGSPTRRSSCSRAITASRSARIRGFSRPTARSRTRRSCAFRSRSASRASPGGSAPMLVSLVDLAPTLLELLGVTDRDATLDGTTSCPRCSTRPPRCARRSRAIAIHEELQWSVVEWPYQLLVRAGGQPRRALRPREGSGASSTDLAATHARRRQPAEGALRGGSGGRRRPNAEWTVRCENSKRDSGRAMRREQQQRRRRTP